MQILVLLLTQFGPALGGLVANLAERLIAGWKTSAVKSGTVWASLFGLMQYMGCDIGMAEQAVIAAAAASPTLFGVPPDQIVPTLEQAMRARVEQYKKSKEVTDAAAAEQGKWISKQ